ncbi:MAG: TlpA family protein disulfide reductase, partial [Prevotellaceae bacterium]|nr:TlpA family protein disulfide reductase [Prevotellaceae bacterium]
MKTKILFSLFALLISFSWIQAQTKQTERVTAPDFTIKALDGKEITLSNFKGKYVLIDFWGSWCMPCRQSSPFLVDLYSKLKAKKANIEFISIAVKENKGEDIWKKAIENDRLTWIQTNETLERKSISRQYNVYGVPNCFLISP